MRGIEQIPWLYDAIFWFYDRLGLGRWRRWVMGGASGRTLELGCGTGRNLVFPTGATFLVGVEPHRDVLARARVRAPQVPLVRASAEALPFRTGAFDTVVSSLVFCSVPHPARGLAEVRRVLGRGGALRMIEHVRAVRGWVGRLQDVIQPLWTWACGGCHPNRDTEAAVARAGFEVDATEREARGLLRRLLVRPGEDG